MPISVNELKDAPYIKVSPWMTGRLRLKGNALTAFALLFEREHSEAGDTSRIDAAYLSQAMDATPAETFQVLSDLVKKGYVQPDFNGGDFLTAFRVDTGRVLDILNAAPQEPNEDEGE